MVEANEALLELLGRITVESSKQKSEDRREVLLNGNTIWLSQHSLSRKLRKLTRREKSPQPPEHLNRTAQSLSFQR